MFPTVKQSDRSHEHTAIKRAELDGLAAAAKGYAVTLPLADPDKENTAINGPDRVGADAPFGLRVNLRLTREIKREAGGFQKYLQNQTNSPYVFNFGRPTEDYRDKFGKAARAALEEHFEVVSLTFHSDKVESLTDPEFGWRLTPCAYFLLKPKGPQIDMVPPLKIDLDFNDTSGYVVLPVTSAEVPIDAGAIEDRGLRVVELDAAAEDLSPVSEHEWRIELKPDGGVLPAIFHFPAVKPELAQKDGLMRQRYVDVDLVPVDAEVALGGSAKRTTPWIIGGIAALIALIAGLVAWTKRKKFPIHDANEPLPLPSQINAVSVIGYLRCLTERDGLSPALKARIESEIDVLEARHFGPENAPQDPETLEEIARRWQAA